MNITSTYTTLASATSTDPISMESLVKVKQEANSQGPIPNVFRCHPSVYKEVLDYFALKEHEDTLRQIEYGYTVQNPYGDLGRLCGVDVILDKELKVGEWRFEYVTTGEQHENIPISNNRS